LPARGLDAARQKPVARGGEPSTSDHALVGPQLRLVLAVAAAGTVGPNESDP
jgi:hypothetical protein